MKSDLLEKLHKYPIVAQFLDVTFKKFIRNSSWVLISNFGASAIHFAQSIVLARWLGADQFGLLTLIITYGTLVNNLIDLRVWETATRYISRYWVENDKPRLVAVTKLCYLIDSSMGLLGFIVVFVTAPFVASIFLHDPEAGSLIRLYAIGLLGITLNNTSKAIFRVFDYFSWLAYFTIGLALTQMVGVMVLFLLDNFTIRAVLIVIILTEAISGVGLLFVAVKLVRQKAPVRFSQAPIALLRGIFQELTKFLISTNVTAILKTAGGSLEFLLLGYFTTPTQVGYYKVAKNFVALISRVGEPFRQAIYPELAKLWSANQREQFVLLVRKTTILMSMIMLPVVAVLIGFTPMLISWTAGSAYASSVPAVRIMAIGMALDFIVAWLYPAALSTGRVYASNIGLACRLLIWLVGSFLLIPSLGIIGSAILYVLGIGIWRLVMFLFVKDMLSPAETVSNST